MKNQVLTIDQMKHLKKMGVDTSVASMYWTFPSPPEEKTKLSPVGIHGNLKSWEQHESGIGAFTLADVLYLLPDKINGHYMTINNGLGYVGYFYNAEEGFECLIRFNYTDELSDMLKSVYELFVWVVQNGHYHEHTN